MSLLDTLIGRPAPTVARVDASIADPTTAPGPLLLAGEARAGWQAARLLRASPWLARAPRGDGQLVVDLPGWRASEASNAPLRAYLGRLGYDARPWGLGVNQGDPARDALALVERLRTGEGRVGLVGWSLGGVVAREVARALPERIACVVTFGTPVVGGPSYTVARRLYGRERSSRARDLSASLDERNPIQVPITAIFTRSDGIVDWRACIDRRSRSVEHVEVRSTHIGLGIDPDVWLTVARALAQHLGGS